MLLYYSQLLSGTANYEIRNRVIDEYKTHLLVLRGKQNRCVYVTALAPII